jgi:hypothetical protein
MVRVCNDDMRNGSDGYYTRKILGSPLTPAEENVLDTYVSVMFFCNFQPSSDPPQPCPQPKVLGAEPEEGGGGPFTLERPGPGGDWWVRNESLPKEMEDALKLMPPRALINLSALEAAAAAAGAAAKLAAAMGAGGGGGGGDGSSMNFPPLPSLLEVCSTARSLAIDSSVQRAEGIEACKRALQYGAGGGRGGRKGGGGGHPSGAAGNLDSFLAHQAAVLEGGGGRRRGGRRGGGSEGESEEDGGEAPFRASSSQPPLPSSGAGVASSFYASHFIPATFTPPFSGTGTSSSSSSSLPSQTLSRCISIPLPQGVTPLPLKGLKSAAAVHSTVEQALVSTATILTRSAALGALEALLLHQGTLFPSLAGALFKGPHPQQQQQQQEVLRVAVESVLVGQVEEWGWRGGGVEGQGGLNPGPGALWRRCLRRFNSHATAVAAARAAGTATTTNTTTIQEQQQGQHSSINPCAQLLVALGGTLLGFMVECIEGGGGGGEEGVNLPALVSSHLLTQISDLLLPPLMAAGAVLLPPSTAGHPLTPPISPLVQGIESLLVYICGGRGTSASSTSSGDGGSDSSASASGGGGGGGGVGGESSSAVTTTTSAPITPVILTSPSLLLACEALKRLLSVAISSSSSSSNTPVAVAGNGDDSPRRRNPPSALHHHLATPFLLPPHSRSSSALKKIRGVIMGELAHFVDTPNPLPREHAALLEVLEAAAPLLTTTSTATTPSAASSSSGGGGGGDDGVVVKGDLFQAFQSRTTLLQLLCSMGVDEGGVFEKGGEIVATESNEERKKDTDATLPLVIAARKSVGLEVVAGDTHAYLHQWLPRPACIRALLACRRDSGSVEDVLEVFDEGVCDALWTTAAAVAAAASSGDNGGGGGGGGGGGATSTPPPTLPTTAAAILRAAFAADLSFTTTFDLEGVVTSPPLLHRVALLAAAVRASATAAPFLKASALAASGPYPPPTLCYPSILSAAATSAAAAAAAAAVHASSSASPLPAAAAAASDTAAAHAASLRHLSSLCQPWSLGELQASLVESASDHKAFCGTLPIRNHTPSSASAAGLLLKPPSAAGGSSASTAHSPTASGAFFSQLFRRMSSTPLAAFTTKGEDSTAHAPPRLFNVHFTNEEKGVAGVGHAINCLNDAIAECFKPGVLVPLCVGEREGMMEALEVAAGEAAAAAATAEAAAAAAAAEVGGGGGGGPPSFMSEGSSGVSDTAHSHQQSLTAQAPLPPHTTVGTATAGGGIPAGMMMMSLPHPQAPLAALEFMGLCMGWSLRFSASLPFDWAPVVWRYCVGAPRPSDALLLARLGGGSSSSSSGGGGGGGGSGGINGATGTTSSTANPPTSTASTSGAALGDGSGGGGGGPLGALRRGLGATLPLSALAGMPWRVLRERTAGTPGVSLAVLQAHVTYQGEGGASGGTTSSTTTTPLGPNHPSVVELWRVLGGWSSEELGRLLKCITGALRLPLPGTQWSWSIKLCSPSMGSLVHTSSCTSVLYLPQCAKDLDFSLREAVSSGLNTM